MENKPTNHFGQGLLVGAVIGAAAYFFLGTKKGKRLLKYVREESIDTISEWGEVASDEETLERLHELKNTDIVQKGEKLVKEVLQSVSSEKSKKK